MKNSHSATGRDEACDEKLAVRHELARAALHLAHEMERTANQIEEAFSGQPLNLNWAPDDIRNRRRFRSYMSLQSQVLDCAAKTWKLYKEICTVTKME